jgi:hypothetical protein
MLLPEPLFYWVLFDLFFVFKKAIQFIFNNKVKNYYFGLVFGIAYTNPLKKQYIMKKIITILAVIGMFSFQSCTTEDSTYIDNDTISTVIETKPVSFLATSYAIRYTFPSPIYSSDVVLVYRLTGASNGNDLWEFLPETHYFADGTRNFSYNFDFTKNDVQIYLEGNNLGTLDAAYRLNQIFRIVVVPADIIYGIDKNNYPAVMNALKINESQVQKIDF